MDQKQIEEIVRSVMASMGQAAPAPSEAKCATTTCAAPVPERRAYSIRQYAQRFPEEWLMYKRGFYREYGES